MGLTEKVIEKRYYTIGEVAEMFGENTSSIRYWEREFDVLKPKKNSKGDRFFTKDDVDILKLIYHLVREKGYTLDGAKTQLKSKFADTEKKFLLTEKLQKLKSFLIELKNNLE